HSFAGEEGPDVGLVLALLAGQGLDGCGGPPCQDVLARTRRGLELGLGGVVREGRGRAERGEGRGEQRGACGGAGGPEEGTGDFVVIIDFLVRAWPRSVIAEEGSGSEGPGRSAFRGSLLPVRLRRLARRGRGRRGGVGRGLRRRGRAGGASALL